MAHWNLCTKENFIDRRYTNTLRQADISNKGVVDAAVYSILADEYFSKQAQCKKR